MSTISKINGVAWASIAKRNGVAVASIAKINGVDKPSSGSPIPDLLWWKCNEGSGTVLTGDGSAGGDDGTHNADYVIGASGSGYALDFNGTSDNAQSDAAITFGTTAITVCFWIKWDAGSGTTHIVIESSAIAASNNNAWVVYLNRTSSRIYAFMRGASNIYRAEYCTAPAAGTWAHCAIVLDRTVDQGAGKYGDVLFYINGSVVAATVDTNTITAVANLDAYVVYVGARASASLWYPGLLDDVRIYSGVLSAAQIATIYADPQ